MTGLHSLSVCEAAERLRSGQLSARDYAQALLARVREVDDDVRAWTHFDPEHFLSQADAADRALIGGAHPGPLHGVPIGVKDIIDTADMPTENGTVLHAGRQPQRDAAVVERLRSAGALLMGKTVTTELATYAPGKTRNPRNAEHTPGGSSSGSAAAVAADMVPGAIGTQTNGSVIRPAAFCGVVGYKPTSGWLSRRGVLVQSPPLDQLGVFARNVEDAALLVQCLAGHDAADAATRPRAVPRLLDVARSEPPTLPMLGFMRTPQWERMAGDAREAFENLVRDLAGRVTVTDVEPAPSAAHALDLHRCVMEADIAASFHAEYERGREHLSSSLRGQIERGRQVLAGDYRRAIEQRDVINAAFEDSCFAGCDAILTPAALGTAPHGLESTGDPVMCTLWTFLGLPAVTLPLLRGANGLPVGVQLVGRRDDDARLLRTANWLGRMLSRAS
jgi:Asp-tRNA(Asn)/Glu-tRNA(Gln) amidotransferase A subunit family amidase